VAADDRTPGISWRADGVRVPSGGLRRRWLPVQGRRATDPVVRWAAGRGGDVLAVCRPTHGVKDPYGSTYGVPLVVKIRNYAFLPQNPVVARGQGVVIVNNDSVAHTWTAAPHSGWSYDSGNIPPGGRATFPGLPRAGGYPVLCLYHAEMPAMTGMVTVR